MIQIRNLLSQPLTFHLSGGQTLHLTSRARVIVPDDLVSTELRNAALRGAIELTPIPETATRETPTIDEPSANAKRRK